MPEEEIEYLDDDNENSNEQSKDATRASSKSSLKDNFNKYKSRKKNSANFDGGTINNTNASSPTLRSRLANGIKNQATNAVLNKVNLHPALKAANTIRNIVTRNNNPVNSGGIVSNSGGSKEDNVATNDIDNDDFKSSDDTSVVNDTNEETQTRQGGVLGSLLGGSSGFLGRFSLIGRLSLPMRIGIIVGSVFLGFFLIIIIVSLPFGGFSSLFGMDEVIASEGGTSGNIDYGDYELSSDGDEILHESLDSFLQSKGTSLEEFNNLIASNVENSGYGTDAGVVAAAVTLIAELGNNYDVKIPYFWGGGHGQMITGAEGNWGSNQCRASANGRIYDYCGLDCSGFVAWAIYNGGFKIAARTAGDFQNLPGAERVSLTESAVLQPGDLIESGAHIVLVVGVDEDAGEYICAEASGYGSGVKFSRRPFNRRGYWGVKMAGFYERQVRS